MVEFLRFFQVGAWVKKWLSVQRKADFVILTSFDLLPLDDGGKGHSACRVSERCVVMGAVYRRRRNAECW